MPQISNNLARIRAALPAAVELVAVSKFQPMESVAEAYAAGQRVFGESRADELVAKAESLPSDCRWHFIGHVQTNKLRRIVPHVAMIQSIDSERLLRLVSDEALRIGRRIPVLLQVHVAAEETKTGFTPDELIACAEACRDLAGVEICGVMGMATYTSNISRIDADFAAIAATGERLRQIIPEATALSMGMSHDWPQAVAHGATMVRIGSDIFGERS